MSDEREQDTGAIDITSTFANMFGATRCPKCRSIYRIPYTADSPTTRKFVAATGTVADAGVIECENCGHTEPITAVKA